MGTTGTPQPEGQQQPSAPAADPVAQLLARLQQPQQGGPMGVSIPQPPQPKQPNQMQPLKSTGGGKRQSVQNLGMAIQNFTGQLANKVNERKQREVEHVFKRYTDALTGITQGQTQMQQAQQESQQALQEFQKATTPEEKQAAAQKLKGIAQRSQQAAQSLQANRAILDSEYNAADPKGQKHIKMLQKGWGIDDKNAATPERQAMKKVMQEKMGIGAGAASVAAGLPQTQRQPQGPQQKPATQGQMLTAATQMRGQDLREREHQATLLEKNGVSSAYIQLRATKEGQVAEKNASGDWAFRPMTEMEKRINGMASQGKLAWIMKDGKPVAVNRDPRTNQIIPNTENPALLPPSYMTDHIREDSYAWTDADGNTWMIPRTSTTKPVLQGQSPHAGITGIPMNKQGPKATPAAPASGGKTPTAPIPGAKLLGKGKQDYAAVRLRTTFETNYEKPAEDVERSAQMINYAYDEYKAAAAKGESLPTGAQSMVALSSHVQSTFGTVKGSRVTKDMIEHHFHARGVSDDVRVAFQKLNDGDPLSPAQWEAFHDLVNQSRKEQWTIAAKESSRFKLPKDFIPPDLLKQGVGAPEGFQEGRDGAYVGSDKKTVIGWQIDGKYVSE